MTDVVTRNDTADETQAIAAAGDAANPPTEGVQWAPTEPAPKKRHLALWIGVPVGVLALGAVAASLVLIAPGTSVAGVPVGFMTPGAATDAIASRLASTEIVLAGDGGDATLTGADLGASVDARALADAAFADRPMWNVTQWFGEPETATATIDTDATAAALREAAPTLYTAPTDAVLTFDEATASYVVTPAVDGEGIDGGAVAAALQQAFDAGAATVVVDPQVTAIEAPTTTAEAQTGADLANGMLENIGFYVGEERTVPVDRAVAASWFTLDKDDAGGFVVDVDEAQIQTVVDTLPGLVDRAAVDATVITDTAGTVLSDVQAGQTGRALGSTDGVAADFAEQLSTGNAVFALPVTETPFVTTTLARSIDVDLGDQRVYLKENGAVVDSWAISSGLGNTPTFTGDYKVGWKTTSQTMNGYNRDAAGNITGTYSTPNVKWAMYFNGDQAFHGVYWHNNFGNRMSHGCVGMPEWRAQQLYEWAPKGVDVSIHN